MISVIRFIRFLRIGVGISDTDVEYADSTSNTVAPTTGWQTEAPKWQNGHYIWSRTHIYYTNGTEKITEPVCLPSGKGIDKILEMYYQSTSATTLNGGTWVPEPPKWQNGYYIWTCSFIYYTDGSMTPTKPVCTTGAPGESAVSIQISMPAILHKKSNYAATYSITVKAMRDGELLGIKSSIRFDKSMVVGVIPKKSVSGKVETITVSISANISANVNMIYEATVAGRAYSYTIPIRTIEDGADGKPGADGKNGKWMRGPQSWEDLMDGYTFYPLSDEDSEMFDVVEYGGKYYECNKKHVKSSDTTPLDDYTTYGGKGNWSLSSQFSFVATKVLWSKIGQIDFFGSQSINVYGESNNSRICLRDGIIEIFGSVNAVIPNIRFGVDPATGCAIMSYYDNKGNWLYDLGPGGWDNKNVTKGRLESFDYLPAHEYLNLINKGYGMTASDSLYEPQAFKIDDKSYYYNVAVTKVDICLFPRSYADDSTELSKHPITGYEPGARITSWKKLYQYTAGRKDSLYFADSAHNLTAELAKEADGKWFTSGNICDGSKLINLASGKYVRRGTSVRMMKVLHVSLGGTTKVPAYGFDIGVFGNLSHKMESITISSQICRTIGNITLN
jgi:hypothetical protein